MTDCGGYDINMKSQTRSARFWRIRGYDSTAEILDMTISIGQITESGLEGLLRALVARDLSPSELVGAYAKRGTLISNRLLDVRRSNDVEKRRMAYTCGENPHYIATLELEPSS